MVHGHQKKSPNQMPCYKPITAYQSQDGGPLSFALRSDQNTVTIPCGQCSGCRLKKSREWAVRCMNEKIMHKRSCTITLTYDDEHLPKDLSLKYRDFQLYMKRLRRANPKTKILFYMGGEYGETYGRPHYHAAMFGIDYPDQIYHKKTPTGHAIYTSPTLSKQWGKGYAAIGQLTFESAAYIARYIMKKMTGDGNKTHYEIIDIETGEIQLRKKEFNQMSRRPGIGAAWLEKYEGDAYPQGTVVIRNHTQNAPRYYDKKWAEKEPDAWEELQHQRYKEGLKYITERTPERLAVQEQVQAAKTKSLQRGKI